MTDLTISKTTLRRFILGRQGLWPGRRWAGKEGTAAALRAVEAVQIDPLNVVARSHDIVLWSRVAGYQPDYLDSLLYQERAFFDYGGAIFIYPMTELPYWRLSMGHKGRQPRVATFLAENQALVEAVREQLGQHGPQGNRHFTGTARVNSYRSGKDTGLALYNLWLTGELMTHHRHNFQRIYDFRQHVAPVALDYEAPTAVAEHFFARKSFAFPGMVSARGWRNMFGGFLERKVDQAEAQQRLEVLLAEGEVTAVQVEGHKDPFYVLSADLPLLVAAAEGRVPAAWEPIGPTTEEEVAFLAPLDIVSARGRAKWLFDFEYIWEVYKPASARRWGYYTLPILYGDRLVARLDPKLDRKTGSLIINGFWLEEEATAADLDFAEALARGLDHFARFLKADHIDLTTIQPASLRQHLTTHISTRSIVS